MKKITLLVAGLLFAGNLASASETTIFSGYNNHYTPVNYSDAEPIVFLERGVEFMVFTTGEIDFNTVPATTGNTYYRGGRRTNTREQSNGRSQNNAAPQGVKVEQDAMGHVRRVGNVYINYDRYGRVNRIGTVYMIYNRFALSQVGGLSLIYDRQGRIVNTYGTVNNSTYNSYQPIQQGNSHSHNGNNGNNQNGNSNSQYYYRPAAKDSARTK